MKNIIFTILILLTAYGFSQETPFNSIDKNDLPNILNLYQGKKITRENSSTSKGYFIKQKDIK